MPSLAPAPCLKHRPLSSACKSFLFSCILCLSFSLQITGQSISLSPNSGARGEGFGITVTGSAVSWSASSTHCVEVFDGTTTITFTGTVVGSSTIMTGTLNIPADANIGTYDAQVYDTDGGACSGATDGTCTNCFTVIESSISLSTRSGLQGDNVSITITGTGTSWTNGTSHCVEIFNGTTTLSFIGTAGAGNTISGNLQIPNDAIAASYNVRIYDLDGGACSGAIDGACTNCFTVNDSPTISFSPTSGDQGASFSVTVTGADVNFAGTSSHCIELTNGPTTLSFVANKVASSTILTGTATIPAMAPVGSYDGKVYNIGNGSCTGSNAGVCSGCFTVAAVLPVEWLSFTGKPLRESIQLDWATAAEINTGHFEIQRSPDGQQWHRIGQVAAAGQSTAALIYSFLDDHPLQGTNFYRIRQVDLDGQFSYSKMIAVNFEAKYFSFDLYPNPTSSSAIHVRLHKLAPTPLDITIYDVDGKLVRHLHFANPTNNQVLLDIKDLEKGVYIVNAEQSGFLFTRQLVRL